MSVVDFEKVQRAVLSGATSSQILALLPTETRLVTEEACPTCNGGYVAQLPDSACRLICLACGLEFEV